MSDTVIAQIRTIVPIAVGALLTWLATKFKIVIDEQTQTQLVLGLQGLITAVYYSVVRILEDRFPQLGILLGSTKKPVYFNAVDAGVVSDLRDANHDDVDGCSVDFTEDPDDDETAEFRALFPRGLDDAPKAQEWHELWKEG